MMHKFKKKIIMGLSQNMADILNLKVIFFFTLFIEWLQWKKMLKESMLQVSLSDEP